MKLVRKGETGPDDGSGLGGVRWLEGPHMADRLDVGVVHADAGHVTPPHIHLGGQVMVVLSGQGFVETNGTRIEMTEGDVVICAPGEAHIHGAVDHSPVSHLTVTTGRHEVPPAQ